MLQENSAATRAAMEAMQQQLQVHQQTMGKILQALKETQREARLGDPDDRDHQRRVDKVNALAGLEFKQQLPVLKDSDTDFDKHWRRFRFSPHWTAIASAGRPSDP